MGILDDATDKAKDKARNMLDGDNQKPETIPDKMDRREDTDMAEDMKDTM